MDDKEREILELLHPIEKMIGIMLVNADESEEAAKSLMDACGDSSPSSILLASVTMQLELFQMRRD